MPRLRSQTRRPALRVLPRDVLARCIEFLPFDQALELKQVSKDVRPAARRAITHRWRAIKFVATKALDMVLQDSVQLGAAVPAEALLTFRAAWDLDPGLVVREIAEWEDGSALTDDGFWAAVFLKLVEPRIDGLPRVVAACERTHRFVESSPANRSSLASMHPVHMLVKWSRLVERPLKLNFHRDDNDNDSCLYIASLYDEIEEYDEEHFGCALFGSGLEAWDDPALAAGFVFALMEEKLDPHAPPFFVDLSDHRRWSRHWQDRDKAGLFVRAAQDLHVWRESYYGIDDY